LGVIAGLSFLSLAGLIFSVFFANFFPVFPESLVMEPPFKKDFDLNLDRRQTIRSKRMDRLIRIIALLLLCGLVWYFSYDQGRSTAKKRVYRLEAENISLREQIALLEKDIEILKQGQLPGAPPKPADPPASTHEPGSSSDDQSKGRLTVKLSENKTAFGGKVIVSLVELNSIDQEALVRLHFTDSNNRQATIMNPGDIFEFELEGQPHKLYLDQIKGSLAFFILDGLPSGG
jgi:hypothetical protein